MFVKALLLDIYFYNINMNLSKYRMAGNLFNLSILLSKSKKIQHICLYGKHGSNVSIEVVSVADS